MSAESILKFSKKLDKIISGDKPEDGAMDILKILKSTPVTLEVLQKTRIGMTVNELRKRVQNKEVQIEAKNLIKVWKKLLDDKSKEKDGKTSLSTSESVASNMSDSNSNDIPDSAMSVDSESSAQINVNNDKNMNINNQKSKSSAMYDDVRSKSRDLILKSLTYCDLPADSLDTEQLATDIEQAIFNLFSSTSEKYRASIRSRVFNLRDKKNPELRENILLGALSPEKFAKMTAEEMASQEMREMRKKMTKQAINDHQTTLETGTPTDMFKCGKCGKKNCSYTQVQTRSADEPMTTFVFCRECGNRWKFC